MTDLLVCHLGRVAYRDALELQAALRARVQAGELGDLLLLLEHPPVYTLGRRSEPGDLPMGESWYLSQGIDVVRTDRGGKLTYHGPGQLVGYPIVHVERIPDHIAAMEGAIADALEQEGLPGARGRDQEGPEWTGVWIEDRKIASIGVHVSRGVSMHGFAVNVDNDLQPFEWVVACGLPTTRMTSICKERGQGGRLPCFRKRVAYAYAQRLGKRQRLVSASRLLAAPVPA
jgi:lipoyl(octanoyl) transferase